MRILDTDIRVRAFAERWIVITFAVQMNIEILKSKIHNVKVTQTELNYVGSITLDQDLLDEANLIAGEKVLIVNNNNGERLETYIIVGDRGTGMCCLNGAAARKAQVGDTLIVMSFAHMDFEEAKSFTPWAAYPDHQNKLPLWNPPQPML